VCALHQGKGCFLDGWQGVARRLGRQHRCQAARFSRALHQRQPRKEPPPCARAPPPPPALPQQRLTRHLLRREQYGCQVGAAALRVVQRAAVDGVQQRAPVAVLLYNPHLRVAAAQVPHLRRRQGGVGGWGGAGCVCVCVCSHGGSGGLRPRLVW
jgi:hypothetical protein